MKVQTIHWGEIEAEYWRDDQGREGLRPAKAGAGLPPSLVPGDLTNGDWQMTLFRAIAARYPRVPLPEAKPAPARAPEATPEEKAQAARDRMANARAARRVNFKQEGPL